MSESNLDDLDALRLDISKLTSKELEVLAQLILKKLREAMRQERDRSGNL